MRTFCSVRAKVAKSAACLVMAVSILVLLGCGGNSSQNPNPQSNSAALQVNIGDSPSDRLVAVSMTIGSLTLRNSGEAASRLFRLRLRWR